MSFIAIVDEAIVDDALIWAKLNCPTYITNYNHYADIKVNVHLAYHRINLNKYDFFFSSAEDLAWFNLRWGR